MGACHQVFIANLLLIKKTSMVNLNQLQLCLHRKELLTTPWLAADRSCFQRLGEYLLFILLHQDVLLCLKVVGTLRLLRIVELF